MKLSGIASAGSTLYVLVVAASFRPCPVFSTVFVFLVWRYLNLSLPFCVLGDILSTWRTKIRLPPVVNLTDLVIKPRRPLTHAHGVRCLQRVSNDHFCITFGKENYRNTFLKKSSFIPHFTNSSSVLRPEASDTPLQQPSPLNAILLKPLNNQLSLLIMIRYLPNSFPSLLIWTRSLYCRHSSLRYPCLLYTSDAADE